VKDAPDRGSLRTGLRHRDRSGPPRPFRHSRARGLPFYAILSLPILFAAGMSTFDALDGCFMNSAYGWAFSRPIRMVYYNVTITGLSVAVDFIIGSIEILGLLSSELDWNGGAWSFFEDFNINTGGFVIVGLFLVTWAVALAIWHFGRIEEKWDAAGLQARASGRATADDLLTDSLWSRSGWPHRHVANRAD
jgi:high-affinity nickel-transport protein